MAFQSDFVLLNVKHGRKALVARVKNKETIEVVIKGTITSVWSDDDDISQEFEVTVTEVKEVIKRKVRLKKSKEFPAPWTLQKKRSQRWYCNNATVPGLLIETTYDTGAEIRMSIWSQKGKPIDWDRAARICNSAYFLCYDPENETIFANSLPQIVSMREVNTGEEFFPPRPNNQRPIKEYRGS